VVQRAARLFHVCAARVALGLIMGLVTRGLVLRNAVGWASSWLGAVRVLLWILYAPAAAICGIALPGTAEQVAVLRVTADANGASPLAWICLIGLTMTLYASCRACSRQRPEVCGCGASPETWRCPRPSFPMRVVRFRQQAPSTTGSSCSDRATTSMPRAVRQ
jgi:hypothetical protein